MKELRTVYSKQRTRKVACTVSAAALMLGVSEAATVGFNFQTTYCAAAGYSGSIVTATAFGIGTNAWESLTPMPTGYGCGGCSFNNMSEVINTTTSSGGLNPLPNGSLTISWGGCAANVSGFGGYNRSGPNYSFGGNNQQPGNEQVYWGFIRDGVNFGPNPGDCSYNCGDNNQPGYNIDITGLKSLFTNSAFAVELIASSDSLWTLTNAFVIDATANTTQSVIYPSIPTPANQGGTLCLSGGGSFSRGVGGGLSTASGAFNTDHLKIIGNRAQHATDFNRASTICGFIITDKPVISMSPQQVLVCGGDTVTWSGYAVGVPPLSYQWRKNGVAIPGATTTAYSLTNLTAANNGTYDLWVTNLYGTAISSSVTVGDKILIPGLTNLVLDSNPKGPAHNGINHGAIWAATNSDGVGITRTGVMSFSTNFPSQITVAGETNFDSVTGTIMFWMRSSGLPDPLGNAATLFDRLAGTAASVGGGKGLIVAQFAAGAILCQVGTGTNSAGVLVSTATPAADNRWHQIAAVYDRSGTTPMQLYVDGQLDSSTTVSAWSWPTPSQPIELGLSHDTNSYQAYNGFLDDVRVYSRALSASEITSAYGGALVDTNALTMQLNFAAPPGAGVNLTWQAPDVILQSADKVSGPYQDVPGAVSPYPVSAQGAAKFYRYRGHTPAAIVSNPYLM
jgi:hypothetical protein